MKIDIIISADYIKDEYLNNKIVVVIDMLRATSVITTAIANGANRVIPLLTVEEALELSKQNRKHYILGGERKAVKIQGFDLSNSPLDYKSEVVNGKDVILTTTNGTRAINACHKAKRIFIGSMLNGKAVVGKLRELNEDMVFVNAGTVGQFSMDDFICAGYMISSLVKDNEVELSDIAFTAKYVYENNGNIIDYIKNARHFDILKNLNLHDDIEYCMQKDIFYTLPEYKNGEIVNAV